MAEKPTAGDFSRWLREIGLDRCVDVFEQQQIDFDIAEDLTDDDLRDIGVSALGDRKRFLKAIGERGSQAAGPSGEFPQGERRQITVLFADIAGYTSLSSTRDAEEIHSMLNAYFDIADRVVREHGGSIDKHIGDAVMAVFGAPVAHSDDPLRAVLSALEIHRRLAELDTPIRVHVGIASGEVVAGGTGSDAYQEYTVTGSTVNLASRLDGLANPGETYVSDEVYSAVSESVIGRTIGEVTVKGFEEPITVWSVDGRLEQQDRSNAVRICGRTSECGVFENAASSCRHGSSGKLFYLRGEPGIGKSCLAESFHSIAEGVGLLCVDAMSSILEQRREERHCVPWRMLSSTPSKPSRVRTCRSRRETGLVTAQQKIHLYDLLDVPLPAGLRALYDAMDNETRRGGRHDALIALVRGACGLHPRFIWVDNVHWGGRAHRILTPRIGPAGTRARFDTGFHHTNRGRSVGRAWIPRHREKGSCGRRPRSPRPPGRAGDGAGFRRFRRRVRGEMPRARRWKSAFP